MKIEYKKKSGIYLITSAETGKRYVGSATCLYTRYHTHLNQLRNQKHSNIHLQRIFEKYGVKDLRFSVLEICEKSDLTHREQWYLDSMAPEINICKIANKTTGYKPTKEQREYMSIIRKGKQSKAMLGKKHTEHTKALIAEKCRARGLSEAFKAASILANTGRKKTAVEIEKMVKKQRKITPEQALEIKVLRENGVYQMVLAKRFGVSQRVIVRVEKGIGVYGSDEYLNHYREGEAGFKAHAAKPVLFAPEQMYSFEQSKLFQD